MTGTDLALRTPTSVQLSTDQLQYIAHTEFVPPGLRGNLPAILACVATGRELGIGDMVSLKTIHIIDGKATFSAELMVMLVRRAGHSIVGGVRDGAATVTGTRGDNGDTMTVEWTLAMAERAGLLNKQNWRRYPESMLWARAVSQLCRMLFADCFAGATYVTEELEDEPSLSEREQPRAGKARDRSDELHAHTDQTSSELVQGAGGNAPARSESDGSQVTVGEPSADIPGIEAATASAASAAQDSQASRPASPTVDMDDPDIPFGNAPYPEPEPITGPQKKKLNVLVGKLRPDVVSTEELWRMCDRPPKVSEDGEVHWSPLRDQLRKGEASRLIEQLNALEVRAIEDRLVAYAAEHGNEDTIVQLIDQKRQDLDLEAFGVWIRKQGANLDAKLKAAAA